MKADDAKKLLIFQAQHARRLLSEKGGSSLLSLSEVEMLERTAETAIQAIDGVSSNRRINRYFAGHDNVIVRDAWQRLITITRNNFSPNWTSYTGVIRRYTKDQRLVQSESIDLLSSLLYSDGGYTRNAIKMAAIDEAKA